MGLQGVEKWDEAEPQGRMKARRWPGQCHVASKHKVEYYKLSKRTLWKVWGDWLIGLEREELSPWELQRVRSAQPKGVHGAPLAMLRSRHAFPG